MVVSVQMMPLLAKRAKSKAERFSAEYEPGMHPHDILAAEGFSQIDMEAILVVVNGGQAELDAELADGDGVEFMIGIQGGRE